MHDDIRQANFTTKPRFKKYKLQILSWTNFQGSKDEKNTLVSEQHEGAKGLRKFFANEAWW